MRFDTCSGLCFGPFSFSDFGFLRVLELSKIYLWEEQGIETVLYVNKVAGVTDDF